MTEKIAGYLSANVHIALVSKVRLLIVATSLRYTILLLIQLEFQYCSLLKVEVIQQIRGIVCPQVH